jgi:SAM-dependent methyltransferase
MRIFQQLKPTLKRIYRSFPAVRLLTRLRLGFGVHPFSYFWGIDRGFPIHRYYLERFLEVCAHDIRGHCLEFQEDSYTSRFGKDRVTRLDILHREEGNPHATLVADLTKPNDIPSNQFDCIICTHVLHIVFELDTILAELYRILKPGGVLLVAVPNVSMCKPEFEEMWRFTPAGLYRLLAKQFGEDQVTVQAYGNSLTAAGEIRGLVAWEFTRAELDVSDPYFPVEVCARAVKREPELRFPPNRAESSSTT